MSKVFFLGAGASVDAGYPLASQLMKTLDKYYKHNWNSELKEKWAKFNKFIKAPRGRLIKPILRSENIEIVLTLTDLLVTIVEEAKDPIYEEISNQQKTATSDKEFSKIIADYYPSIMKIDKFTEVQKTFIKLIDNYFMSKHDEDFRNKSSYTYLQNAFKNLSEGDVVITTNWDTLAERALLDMGYWCPGDGYNFHIQLNEYKQHIRHNNEINLALPQSKVKVLKLHGGVGWRDNNKSIYLDNLLLSNIFIPNIKKQLVDANYPEFGHENIPVLILPSYIKQITIKELQNIWLAADQHLKTANEIIFIGYSLPDADIGIRTLLNPLRERLRNKLVKIICLLGADTPQSRNTRKQWQDFLGDNICFIFESAKNYFD